MSELKDQYFVYILKCSDGSFYTGITNNLEQRLIAHNTGTASKYTRSRRPVCFVYTEPVEDKSAALKREREIKKLPRPQKLKLIEGDLQMVGCNINANSIRS